MITHYLSNRILDAIVARSSSITGFNGVAYVGLSSTQPTAEVGSGTGFNKNNVTEPVGNGYSRALLGNTAQSLTLKMSLASNGQTKNTDIVYFPEATGNWGTLNYFCIFDGANANANLLAFGSLEVSITPTINTVPIVRVGELTVTFN